MNKRIEQVLPGEILAADLKDPAGRLLFPRGATLTENVIEALTHRGVTDVEVEDARKRLSTAQLKQAAERARKFYAGHDVSLPPGPVLLGLRTEAEALRMEQGLSPLLRDCRGPLGSVLSSKELPVFCLESFEPPQLSAVAQELNLALSVPDPSSSTVVEIISRSPGLTARLLRLVNTPIYGFQRKVETISRAVSIVGLREVGLLASSLLMVEQFGVIPKSVIEMRTFLEHSLGCALTCKELAETTGLAEAEQAFVAGLLHDVGRLYFFTSFPERSRFCIDSALKHQRPLLTEEALFFGVDHATMGQRLLDGWKMPEGLGRVVGSHHDPLLAPGLPLAGIVHMADILTHATGLGCSGECGPPQAHPEVMDLVPIRPEQMVDIATRIEQRLGAIMGAF
ncbi:MAG: HDOD domain-containing protein [Desulfomicrobium sp.]|nr:HDOD domain-containing protein [Pseudomonadota bacterium]MBV1712799.1 HDOD domain-containing protein [Desulfomicrobium sp.]MBU4571769.1 HDOD domain-containing protein [Pseudomonadota bacterium]MBU4595918.1 HDOD domain-containing protein [Pseudomonadota bacterium]MBV1721222.1 HDOD domain-containing protein [Desulfomicrobium sp.]